jgi:hypothetical protein
MLSVRILLLLLAFICFVLSALGVPSSRVNLQSLGLALWVVTLLVP